jgi:ABC-type multidrug transport system fused ATPase/permease subunit
VVALVGPSGSGKSTVLGLLLRMYELQDGNILLDNVPIRDLNTQWLREQVGVVRPPPSCHWRTRLA